MSIAEGEINFGNRTNGSGNVSASDTLDRRVEVVKGLALDNLCADLASNTEARESTLDSDKSTISHNQSLSKKNKEMYSR